MTPELPVWRALQAAISGDVILPVSPDYESARKPAIVRYDDVHSRAVVPCQPSKDLGIRADVDLSSASLLRMDHDKSPIAIRRASKALERRLTFVDGVAPGGGDMVDDRECYRAEINVL
jgi:hypothetical protein